MRSLLCLLLVGTPAWACTCAEPPESCQKALEKATVVFVGTVRTTWLDAVATRVAHLARPLERLLGERRVRFAVEEAFRGASTKFITVSTGYTGCTFGFGNSQQFLIYAVAGDQLRLYTSACTGTQPLALAERDLIQLRSLKPAGRL